MPCHGFSRDIRDGDEPFQKPCFIGVAHLRGKSVSGRSLQLSLYPDLLAASPRRRVAVTLSSSDIPSPHPLDGLECLDGSHRAGKGNLIRCTPVLDEGYVPGNYFVSGRQGADGIRRTPTQAKKSTCARVFGSPLAFPTRPVDVGATFPF